MNRCLVPIAGLLSACGVGMLVMAARSGAGGWDYVLWQLFGCAVGVWCHVIIRRRRARRRDRLSANAHSVVPPVLVGMMLVAPTLDFGIDRALLSEVLRLLSVTTFCVAVLRCAYDWAPGERLGLDRPPPLEKGLWVVLALAGVLAVAQLLLGRLLEPLVVAVTAGAVLRAGGHRRLDALMPVMAIVPFLVFLVLPNTWLRYQRSYRVQAISAGLRAPERTLAGRELLSPAAKERYGVRLFARHPRRARDVTIATIVGATGYTGAWVVAALFAVIGWVGARNSRAATAVPHQLNAAGMTAVLVAPALVHIVGCLGLLMSTAGALPFVGYGPGQLVLAWVALAVVADSY